MGRVTLSLEALGEGPAHFLQPLEAASLPGLVVTSPVSASIFTWPLPASLLRTLVLGQRADLDPGQSHLDNLTFITPAKTLLLNLATSAGSAWACP